MSKILFTALAATVALSTAILAADNAPPQGFTKLFNGKAKSQVNIWCREMGSGEVWGYRTDKKQPEEVIKACRKSPGRSRSFR